MKDKNIWIADDAVIFGDVELGEDSSVYYHCVLRIEEGTIRIGRCTNIQDNTVVHGGKTNPVSIGDYVTVGHSCIIHGCTIGNDTLIGMGSIIMDHVSVGNNCIIGAGSLVTENTVIPDGCLAYGRPAKVIRTLTENEIKKNHLTAEHYREMMKVHKGSKGKQ